MDYTGIKDSVYKIVNSIIDEEDSVKIGSLSSCKTDSECNPDLCDKNRGKCFKYIKHDNNAYPIDVFVRKMFESNIAEVKPFEYMLKTLEMTECISKIFVHEKLRRVLTYIEDESLTSFYYKYSKEGICNGISVIFISYERTDSFHANAILVENVDDFLIWNYYEPHGYNADRPQEMDMIKSMGELCAKIANKKFIFNHKEGAQCPVGIQELLNDYDPGYCLLFSYFWIWCVLNVIKRMNTYIPSNQWISYVEQCFVEQISKDKVKVYKRVISFAHSLYESYPTDKKSEKLNNSGYMGKHSIYIDEYNERVSMSDIGKNRGKYGEQFSRITDSVNSDKDEENEEDSAKNIPGTIASKKIDIYDHLNVADRVIFMKSIKYGMIEQIEKLYDSGMDFKELILHLKEANKIKAEEDIPADVKEILLKDQNFDLEHPRALLYAIGAGYLPIVKYLVKKGVDIHAKDDLAVRYAINKQHLPIVEFLIEKGADINAINVNDIPDDPEIKKYLRKKGLKI